MTQTEFDNMTKEELRTLYESILEQFYQAEDRISELESEVYDLEYEIQILESKLQ